MWKICDWCSHDFEANVSYQIYCGAECRTAATRDKNAAKQRDKRYRSRKYKERKCATCKSPLSIYNDSSFCSGCIGDKKEFKRFLRGLK